jgi:hypothetical protein
MLAVGTTLGPYRIVAPLHAGGALPSARSARLACPAVHEGTRCAPFPEKEPQREPSRRPPQIPSADLPTRLRRQPERS